MYGLVVTSHMNATLSGVAKFNRILADRLGVPCVGFGEAAVMPVGHGRFLLSIKMADATEEEAAQARALMHMAKERDVELDLFLHTFDGSPLEYDLLDAATRVFCGNAEIRHALAGHDKTVLDAWCPFLVDLDRNIGETPFNVFSFGMAHKLQLAYYRKLHAKLEESQPSYSLWISTAFHEKANFGDFHSISNQLSGMFGDRIRFLGFLSDAAINYFLERIHLFVAFFPKGVRANNTSIYVPLEKGLPVLTNLDAHSPSWMRHGVNVLDIERVTHEDFVPNRLSSVATQGQRDGRTHASWDALVEMFKR